MSPASATRIIAHRGASGYLPEHTLAAKSLAYGLGADFLEQDLVATRDGSLIVLHDLWLDDVCDVARIKPGRQRDDGRHYVADFDLAELEQLRLQERRSANDDGLEFPGRFAAELDTFRIVSLLDELQFVRELNRTSGRGVGVYPEIKYPGWHRDQGIDSATILLTALDEAGYTMTPNEVFIQCFDAVELKRLKAELGTNLPLIQLLTLEDASRLTANEIDIDSIAHYAHGIGLPYLALLQHRDDGYVLEASLLARRLRDKDLLVHPYTFRRDLDPAPAATFDALLDFFIVELMVDALFTDHPDIAVHCRDAAALPGAGTR